MLPLGCPFVPRSFVLSCSLLPRALVCPILLWAPAEECDSGVYITQTGSVWSFCRREAHSWASRDCRLRLRGTGRAVTGKPRARVAGGCESVLRGISSSEAEGREPLCQLQEQLPSPFYLPQNKHAAGGSFQGTDSSTGWINRVATWCRTSWPCPGAWQLGVCWSGRVTWGAAGWGRAWSFLSCSLTLCIVSPPPPL